MQILNSRQEGWLESWPLPWLVSLGAVLGLRLVLDPRNVWGAALLPLHSWGTAGEDEALMMSKNSAFGDVCSFQLLVNKVNPSPFSRYVATAWCVRSLCLLTRAVNHHFNSRRLPSCRQCLSSLSCWFSWPWGRGQRCVLAYPMQSGPLRKMVANNPCCLPDRHVVELSLWDT